MRTPIQHSIYKGLSGKMGAVQFKLSAPHYYKDTQKDFTGTEALDSNGRFKEGWKTREGCVFMDIASATGPNIYDWENKITMALSVTDLGKIVYTLLTGTECSLMHDPGAKSETQGQVKKNLSIASPKGVAEGILLTARMTVGDKTKSHMVGLKGDEVVVLKTLLQAAIPYCLAWQ